MAPAMRKSIKAYSAAFLGGVVTVEVGQEHTKYHIHKDLLVEHSEYFKKALNGLWKESEEKNICLDDIQCNDFEIFIRWLYTERVPGAEANWLDVVYDATRHTEWYCENECAMVRGCILGERLQASAFRRAAERTFVDYFLSGNGEGSHAYPQTVIYAFANLPPSSPILRLLIDVQCANFDEESLDEQEHKRYRHDLPVDFLLGVMERYTKIGRGAKATLRARDYHDHTSDEDRAGCTKVSSREHDSDDSETTGVSD